MKIIIIHQNEEIDCTAPRSCLYLVFDSFEDWKSNQTCPKSGGFCKDWH